MFHRSKPVKLLFQSAALSVAGFVALTAFLFLFGSRVYSPGTTHEFHPPATESRESAAQELETWEREEERAGTAIFVPRVPEGDSLGLGVRLSHARFEPGTKTVHAAVAVRAAEAALRERAPLRIALVIDRSGSMEGPKFVQAIAAARGLIDSMGPQDSLGIVGYGTDVKTRSPLVPVTEAGRLRLHTALDRMSVDGGTNLSGGYQAGVDLLLPAPLDAVNRVILLSDGQANEGIVDREQLGAIVGAGLEKGVSLSSMGVGLDYDEVLMQSLARHGAGSYYFIADESRVGAILSEEFGGLQSTVARNTELRFSLGDGVGLVAIDGFEFRRDGSEYVVNLGAFSAEQQRDLLLELDVSGASRGELPVLRTRMSYDDVSREKRRETLDAALAVVGKGEARVDVVVLRRAQQIRTARAFAEAMRLYDSGDRFEAAERLRAQCRENDAFLARYDLEDAAFDRVRTTMSELADDLEVTRRESRKGKWIVKDKYNYANQAVQSSVTF